MEYIVTEAESNLVEAALKLFRECSPEGGWRRRPLPGSLWFIMCGYAWDVERERRLSAIPPKTAVKRVRLTVEQQQHRAACRSYARGWDKGGLNEP